MFAQVSILYAPVKKKKKKKKKMNLEKGGSNKNAQFVRGIYSF